MIFADQSLANRVETAEKELTESFARARQATGEEVAILPLAGGSAVFAGSDCPFTKVIGVGFAGIPDIDELEAVEQFFFARQTKVQVELPTLADPEIGALLTARGYRLLNFENVSGRQLDTSNCERPASDPALAIASNSERLAINPGSALQIAPVTESEAAVWSKTVTHGFVFPDGEGVAPDESFAPESLEQLFLSLGEVAGVQRFLASWEGEPAGGASLRLSQGLAQLSGASVLPPFRRRGIQTAMCLARLKQAQAAGCDLAVVTTQPGSKSQHNVMRQGFEVLYARAVLVKEPPR